MSTDVSQIGSGLSSWTWLRARLASEKRDSVRGSLEAPNMEATLPKHSALKLDTLDAAFIEDDREERLELWRVLLLCAYKPTTLHSSWRKENA